MWVAAVGYGVEAFKSPPIIDAVPRLIGGVISLTFMMIVGHVLLTIGAGAEAARTPMSEQERQVHLAARADAARALAVGLVLVIGMSLFSLPSWIIAQTAVAAFLVAELLRYGLELFYNRRAG
jgi:hypothetical protein